MELQTLGSRRMNQAGAGSFDNPSLDFVLFPEFLIENTDSLGHNAPVRAWHAFLICPFEILHSIQSHFLSTGNDYSFTHDVARTL